MRTAIVALSVAVGLSSGSIGFSSAAVADDVLMAGSLFAFPRNRIVCQFFNGGGQPVSILNPRIIDQFGTSFELTGNQCTQPLAPLGTCGIFVDNSESRSWSCRARISPSKVNVRGVLDIRLSDGTVMAQIELR